MAKVRYAEYFNENDSETLTYQKTFDSKDLGMCEQYREKIQVKEVFLFGGQSISLFIDAELLNEDPRETPSYFEKGLDGTFTYDFSFSGRYFKVVKYARINGDGVFLYEWTDPKDVGDTKKATNRYFNDYDCWGNWTTCNVTLTDETGKEIHFSEI